MIADSLRYDIEIQMKQAIEQINQLKAAFASLQKQAGTTIKSPANQYFANLSKELKKSEASASSYAKTWERLLKQKEDAENAELANAKRIFNERIRMQREEIKIKEQAQKQLDALNKKQQAPTAPTGGGGSFMEMAGALSIVAAKAMAVYSAVRLVFGEIAKGVQFNAMLESTNMSFKVMLGSAYQAAQLMKDLRELSLFTPIGLEESAKSAKQLIAYGFKSESLVDNMKMLGTVTAATGGNLDDLAYVYGTLRTQGKAYSRDLMQFAMRGIPIYENLAAVMGMTSEEMIKLVKAGSIDIQFGDVEQAFKRMTSEGGVFFGMLTAKMDTLEGKTMVLERRWTMLMGDLASSSVEPLKRLADAITAEISRIDFSNAGNGIASAINSVIPMITQLTRAMLSAFNAIGKYVALLSKIPALSTIFEYLFKFSEFIFNLIGGVADAISKVFSVLEGKANLGDVVTSFTNAFNNKDQGNTDTTVVDTGESSGKKDMESTSSVIKKEIVSIADMWKTMVYDIIGTTTYLQNKAAAALEYAKNAGGGVGIAGNLGLNANEVYNNVPQSSGSTAADTAGGAKMYLNVDAEKFAEEFAKPWKLALEDANNKLKLTGYTKLLETVSENVAKQAEDTISNVLTEIKKLEKIPVSQRRSADTTNINELYKLIKKLLPYTEAASKGKKKTKEWNDPGIYEDLLPTTTIETMDDVTRTYNKRVAEIVKAYTDATGSIQEVDKMNGALAIETTKYNAEIAYANKYYVNASTIQGQITSSLQAESYLREGLNSSISKIPGAYDQLDAAIQNEADKRNTLADSLTKYSPGQQLNLNVAKTNLQNTGAGSLSLSNNLNALQAEYEKKKFDMESAHIKDMAGKKKDINYRYAEELYKQEQALLKVEYDNKKKREALSAKLGEGNQASESLRTTAANLADQGGAGNSMAAGALSGVATGIQGTEVGTMISALTSSGNILVSVINLVVSALMKFEGVQDLLNIVTALVGQLYAFDYVLEPIVNIVGVLVEIIAQALNPVLEIIAAVMAILYAVLTPVIAIIQILGAVITFLSDYIIIPICNVIIWIVNAIIDMVNGLLGWLGVHIKRLREMETSAQKASREENIKKATSALEAAIDYLKDRLQEEVDAAVSSLQDLYEVGAISASEYEQRSKEQMALLNKYDDTYSILAQYLPKVLEAQTSTEIDALLQQLIPMLASVKEGNVLDLGLTNTLLGNILTAIRVQGVGVSQATEEQKAIITTAIKYVEASKTQYIGNMRAAKKLELETAIMNKVNDFTYAYNSQQQASIIADIKVLEAELNKLFENYWDKTPIVNTYKIPSGTTPATFDVGTGYVPNDMSAYIHKGEVIIPKTFADSIRSGDLSLSNGNNIQAQGDMYITVNVAGSIQTEDDLARSIAKSIYRQRSNGMLTV